MNETILVVQDPWLLIGYFNQVECAKEKFNTNSSLVGASDFQNTIFQARLIDVKSYGA